MWQCNVMVSLALPIHMEVQCACDMYMNRAIVTPLFFLLVASITAFGHQKRMDQSDITTWRWFASACGTDVDGEDGATSDGVKRSVDSFDLSEERQEVATMLTGWRFHEYFTLPAMGRCLVVVVGDGLSSPGCGAYQTESFCDDFYLLGDIAAW